MTTISTTENVLDRLIAAGLIDWDTAERASAEHQRSGSTVEEILVSERAVTRAQYAAATAAASDLTAVDLEAGTLDEDLVRTVDGRRCLAEGWIPVRRDRNGTIVVAVTDTPSEETQYRIALALGGPTGPVPTRFVLAARWQLTTTLLRLFGPDVADEASVSLWRTNPVLSARTVLSRQQSIGGVIALIVLVGIAVVWPVPLVVAIATTVSVVFLLGTGFKFVVAMRGARYDVVEKVAKTEVDALQDNELPVYTVLVPVFREANIVAQLVKNLGGIDYPTHKLEVLILIEQNDQETRDALEAADPPPHFHVVTIPAGHPQTKPRACNVGLMVAKGEFLVIYDAEDTPDPDQLKKAVIAFRRGGEKLACVQAALNYFNAHENVLTRMFTLEYSYWFDYMLPGLEVGNLPIPLGGTSNHFRTSALIELGGWDPFNVTEDADLGIRSSALGYEVGVINSTTLEEANKSVPNFIRQRSRWIKGYMQTTLVHARRPAALIAEVGWVRFLSFALLIGGTPATFLGVIPFYLITAITVIVGADRIAPFMPIWLLWICLFNFLIGNGIMIYLSMMGPFKRASFSLVLWAILNPVYWILHSIASYKALAQLILKPHYWEKTNHGLTTHSAD